MEKSLQLQDLKVSNLPELQGWKEKQQQLVADNPYVEILDNKTYEVACKSRTALLKGRTELEKQDKLIASQLTSFRKEVKSETENLIAITLPHEEKQQAEVKRYESIKEDEKAEKERLEQERVDGIKNRIDSFESDSYKIIQDTTIDNVELHKTMLYALVNVDFDFEEFDILFEQARQRIQSSWDLKCSDIQEKEAQRLENERLQKEAEEAKRVAELQSSRLNMITPYIAYGEPLDLTNLHSIEVSAWSDIIASKKALFEAEQKKQQEAQEKIESDKQKIFEIRKARLEKDGFILHNGLFSDADSICNIQESDIRILDVIDFETLITDSVLAVDNEKERRCQVEEQRIIDEKLAKEDAEKLKKDNKARKKRLAKDKENISLILSYTDLYFKGVETENIEILDFIKSSEEKIKNLKIELLTELKNL